MLVGGLYVMVMRALLLLPRPERRYTCKRTPEVVVM